FCLTSACSSTFSFVFLVAPRPPCSTPFPYTTLFRSMMNLLLWQPRRLRVLLAKLVVLLLSLLGIGLVLGAAWTGVMWLVGVPGADRKSTRLNSSHVKISYAVFCLKKKKQTAY